MSLEGADAGLTSACASFEMEPKFETSSPSNKMVLMVESDAPSQTSLLAKPGLPSAPPRANELSL
jgi:hypothetical protein